MKDLFDKGTEELPLPQKRKRGRPGRQVTEENFHHVLSYFLARHPCKALRDIDTLAPPEHRSRPYLQRKISQNEKWIRQLRDLEGGSRYLNMAERGFTLSAQTGEIERIEAHVEFLKKSIADVSPELISRLQLWVQDNSTKKEWVRCLNLLARKKADREVTKNSISVSEKVFKYLKRLKDDEDDISWDDLLLNMAVAYQEKKKR